MLAAGESKHRFSRLEPPESMGEITVADVGRAESVDEHRTMMREWSRGAWQAWWQYHSMIRSWLPDRSG